MRKKGIFLCRLRSAHWLVIVTVIVTEKTSAVGARKYTPQKVATN